MSRAPDPRIDSDAKRPDPNVSVPGWLNGRPAHRGKVAAVGSWDVYPFILSIARGGLPVNAGRMPIAGGSLTDREASLNRPIAQSPRVRANRRDDAVTFLVALGRLRRDAPRVLDLGPGDTGEHAHAGRYDHHLRAAHGVAADLERLGGRVAGG